MNELRSSTKLYEDDSEAVKVCVTMSSMSSVCRVDTSPSIMFFTHHQVRVSRGQQAIVWDKYWMFWISLYWQIATTPSFNGVMVHAGYLSLNELTLPAWLSEGTCPSLTSSDSYFIMPFLSICRCTIRGVESYLAWGATLGFRSWWTGWPGGAGK